MKTVNPTAGIVGRTYSLDFRWNVFGFFWLESEEPGGSGLADSFSRLVGGRTEKLLTLYVACTVGMLRLSELNISRTNHFVFYLF